MGGSVDGRRDARMAATRHIHTPLDVYIYGPELRIQLAVRWLLPAEQVVQTRDPRGRAAPAAAAAPAELPTAAETLAARAT